MQKVALISEHASPLAVSRGVDAEGQNTYVANVARQLVSRGYRVDVFTRRDDPSLPDVVPIGRNIRVIHVPVGPPCRMPAEALMPHMSAFADFMVNYCTQTSPGYDVLHANVFMSGEVALRVHQALNLPLVVSFHALPDERVEIQGALVRVADAIIVECPQDAKDLLARYDADPHRIEIVPCGFDPHELHPVTRSTARRALGWDDSEFALLHLGRLAPDGGVDNMIRALRMMLDEVTCGRCVKLHIVSGPDMARLAQLADASGVTDHVDFVGWHDRDSLRDLYSAADVFVTTPMYKSFGNAALEAMACAIPVIGSDVGGIQTTIVDGETGFLVPSEQPGLLAGRLAQLRDNRCLAHHMGLAGARRANRHFTWGDVTEQLCAVYAKVTSAQRVKANVVPLPMPTVRAMTVKPAVPVPVSLPVTVPAPVTAVAASRP